jgi:Putative esterase
MPMPMPVPMRALAWFALALLCGALAACGGGGGGGATPAPDTSAVDRGSRASTSFTSRNTGTTYPVSLFLPPASAGARSSLPILYVLDGESWFETLVGLSETRNLRAIIVAVHSAGTRNRDFVPFNSCTPGGGGQAAFLAFIRDELVPTIESSFGGSASQRALFGHSHGGSFVLWAMFSQAPGAHLFKAYLASDASISCPSLDAYGWEQAYASRHAALPLRLHLSYATLGNFQANVAFGSALAQRRYTGLNLLDQAYVGSHNGIVPAVLGDAVTFAFAPSP